MDPVKDGTAFYLVPGKRRGTLALYADQYFERYAEACHATLTDNDEKEDFEQVFYAMATLLDIDKQGRVILPQRVMQRAGLGKRVTLAGQRDHMVIWNRDRFDQFIEENWQRYPDLWRLAQLKTELSKQNGQNGQSGPNGGH